ncbi:hypothetical protein EDB85DRAFT_2275979 [Lactarius pseudohatsudake]|nr:hypothetical protein EDB85DRAFT_2275979 [Lactarius pseudohatsudake]
MSRLLSSGKRCALPPVNRAPGEAQFYGAESTIPVIGYKAGGIDGDAAPQRCYGVSLILLTVGSAQAKTRAAALGRYDNTSFIFITCQLERVAQGHTPQTGQLEFQNAANATFLVFHNRGHALRHFAQYFASLAPVLRFQLLIFLMRRSSERVAKGMSIHPRRSHTGAWGRSIHPSIRATRTLTYGLSWNEVGAVAVHVVVVLGEFLRSKIKLGRQVVARHTRGGRLGLAGGRQIGLWLLDAQYFPSGDRAVACRGDSCIS